MYQKEFKTIDDVIEFLYVNKQPSLALAVTDLVRMYSEALGQLRVFTQDTKDQS